MKKANLMHRKVSSVDLEDVVDEEGYIIADGVIAEDVVSETLAVLLPAGTSLGTLRATYPRIMVQLSKHGITSLKVKNFEQKPRVRKLSVAT